MLLSLLGAPAIHEDGTSRALEFERRTQLLVYVAMKRTWVGRSEVASLLWPDLDAKLAYTNVRKALHRLHSLFGGAVEVQGSALRCLAETDVQAFERALCDGCIADALAAWRGDLLQGFDDDANEAWTGWLRFERERLHSAWRNAAQRRLDDDIDSAEAIDLAARLIEADPLDEDAVRHGLRWLTRAGQHSRARELYREFVARLERELGLPPSASLATLLQPVGTRAGDAAPGVATEHATVEDGFVGRVMELRHIARLLAQDDCRVVCVTGPGGVGKTRLAERAIRELSGRFEGGASFVRLDDVASASELGPRLAQELDIALQNRGSPFPQVVEALRSREALLVLDNLEQIAIGAAPLLEQLLAQCPRIKLLVTSRIRVALPGEWLVPLEGLPCPDPQDSENIETFDAVRLFVRAARRVQPDFSAHAHAGAIVAICQQVEGLPLALELAAAWTRVLSCEGILQELRHGTELLHAVDAAQPARHASVEAVFEQSWRLLADVERDVLARLSVFGGGFDADAARAVTGARLPVMGALVDKSLLRKEGARLRLHPLVQQLAAERLPQASRIASAAAHARYFNRLLAQLRPKVGSGERAALARIDEEFENCRRAWTWAVEHADSDALARSSASLLDYCDYRGRAEEGLRLLTEALAAPAIRKAPGVAPLLASRAAHLEYRLDRYADAERHAHEVLDSSDRSRDRAATLQALNVVATCAFRLGRLEEARRYFKLRLDASSPEERTHGLAVTLDHLSLIEKRLGKYEEARRLSQQSLDLHRQLGDRAGEALCLNNLGALLIQMERSAEALAPLQDGLALCDHDGIVSTRALILSNLADAAFTLGDLDDAQTRAREAIEVGRTIGLRVLLVSMQRLLASIAARRGRYDDARSLLADSIGLAIELGSAPMMFEPVIAFAELLRIQGETRAARRVLALVGNHPAITRNVRDQIAAIEARSSESNDGETPCAIGFDELARRIVAEAGVRHAALIAALNPAE